MAEDRQRKADKYSSKRDTSTESEFDRSDTDRVSVSIFDSIDRKSTFDDSFPSRGCDKPFTKDQLEVLGVMFHKNRMTEIEELIAMNKRVDDAVKMTKHYTQETDKKLRHIENELRKIDHFDKRQAEFDARAGNEFRQINERFCKIREFEEWARTINRVREEDLCFLRDEICRLRRVNEVQEREICCIKERFNCGPGPCGPAPCGPVGFGPGPCGPPPCAPVCDGPFGGGFAGPGFGGPCGPAQFGGWGQGGQFEVQGPRGNGVTVRVQDV